MMYMHVATVLLTAVLVSTPHESIDDHHQVSMLW